MKFLSNLFGKSDKEKQNEAYDLALNANAFFEKEEYDKALKLYIEATRLTPYWKMLHYNIALVHHNMKNYEKAISGFKYSLKLGSENKEIYRQLGNCYMMLDNYLMAINNHKEYIRFNPGDASVLSHLGVCYHNIKNYKQSDKYHLEAITKSPNTSYYYRIFGEILSRRPEVERAYEMFKKAVELVPDDYFSLEKIGDYYAIEKANYEKAKVYYERIPELERTPNVHQNLSAIYFKANDKERCINELEYAAKHYPDNKKLFYLYFSTKRNYKETTNLIEEIELFLQRHPDANKILQILGISYLEEENIKKAFECAKKLIEREPENGHSFILLGACFLMNNEIEKAKIEFTKSKSIFNEGEDTNCEAYAIKGLGCCYLVEENMNEAFSLFQKGLNQVEDKGNYLKNLEEDIQKLSFEGKENAILMIEQLKK